MQLNRLITPLKATCYDVSDIEVSSIEYDSRKVKPGSLFMAIRGEKTDGHYYVKDAVNGGAVAVLAEKKLSIRIPQIVVDDARAAMGVLARQFYGNFDQVLKIGITGTNGKTTTAFLVYSILSEAGVQPSLIGTVYYIGKECKKAVRTTPESLDLFKMLKQFEEEGAKAVVMEVSSHALSLKRVDEIRFDVATFTNLSQDHLDFHRTIDEYRDAKLHLFSLLKKDGTAVYNIDDPVNERITELSIPKNITYGLQQRADIRGHTISDTIEGLHIDVQHGRERYRIQSALIGAFNVYNILAAYSIGCAVNIDFAVLAAGIEKVRGVRGRMERVAPNIFVDYAHTPSAIENALKSLRRYTTGRLVIVFGCGGDRDKGKRPLMGRIASQYADQVIVTSDNPRSESPGNIISDIIHGLTSDNYTVIEDRREAICQAIRDKRVDDVLLIAGKGHEDYQIIGDTVIKFDDTEVVRSCIKNS